MAFNSRLLSLGFCFLLTVCLRWRPLPRLTRTQLRWCNTSLCNLRFRIPRFMGGRMWPRFLLVSKPKPWILRCRRILWGVRVRKRDRGLTLPLKPRPKRSLRKWRTRRAVKLFLSRFQIRYRSKRLLRTALLIQHRLRAVFNQRRVNLLRRCVRRTVPRRHHLIRKCLRIRM